VAVHGSLLFRLRLERWAAEIERQGELILEILKRLEPASERKEPLADTPAF
jgi:hypothetical protein